MIKAIIVDDELSAIKSLQWELENFCKDVEIVDSFTDPIEAISAINYIKPDCIFLDIEMPEMDGFQLLENLKFRDFDLIVTTAYDSYALRAFKESAIDYLLKPIDSDDLIKSVAKIKTNKNKNTLGDELKLVLNSLASKNNYNKIAISLSDKTIFVKPEDIIYCKSSGNYTEMFLKNNEKELVSKKLKDIEELINNDDFCRVHNSYLVNIKHIKEFVKKDGQYLVLENGTSIPISRLKKVSLLQLLTNK